MAQVDKVGLVLGGHAKQLQTVEELSINAAAEYFHQQLHTEEIIE